MHQMVHHIDREQSEQGTGAGVDRQVWIVLRLHKSRDESRDPDDEIDDAHDEGKLAGHHALNPPIYTTCLMVTPSRFRKTPAGCPGRNSVVSPHMAELLRGLTTIRVASARGRVSAAAVETKGALRRPLLHRPCQTSRACTVRCRHGERS